MLRKFKVLSSLYMLTLLMGVAILLSPFKVEAKTDKNGGDAEANPTLVLSYNSGEASSIMKYVDKVNNATDNLCNVSLLTFINDGETVKGGNCSGTLTLDFTEYTNLDQSDKSEVMKTLLDNIKSSGISTVASNKIYNFIQSQDESTASLVRQLSNDVSADFAEAYMMFKPFSGVLGVILGCFSIIIFVTLTLMILVDLSYITIPLIRDYLTQPQGKPKYVSNEAWYAVKEVESESNTNKNTLTVYFKKKSSQFFILSICILYLLSGQIYILIGNAIDMFRGILG